MPKNVRNGCIEIYGVGAHDNPPILSGQIAHGDVALVWRNGLNDFIKPVKGIDHDGIVAIQCNFSLDYTLFIIAVYLPSTNHSIDEFNESIDFLWTIYDSLSEKGYVYVLGDFNADLGNSAGSKGLREPSSRGKKLSKFVDHFNLTAMNLLGNSLGPLETYISHCGRFRSTIVYIIISNCVINSVLYSRTFESCVENTSDHLPVLAKINLDGLSLFKNSVAEITRRPKIRWSDFDKYKIEEKYAKPLSTVLHNLDLDAGSTSLTQALIDTISKISFGLLSKTNTCKKSKAGKIYVKLPLTIKSAKSKLNDLYRVWADNNFSVDDESHVMYILQRSVYRNKLRKFLGDTKMENIKKIHFAADSNEKEFWKLVKGQRSSSQVNAFQIDGCMCNDLYLYF